MWLAKISPNQAMELMGLRKRVRVSQETVNQLNVDQADVFRERGGRGAEELRKHFLSSMPRTTVNFAIRSLNDFIHGDHCLP